jgi:AmmeMemoRadiSam system protein B
MSRAGAHLRRPIAAGRFYDGDRQRCAAAARRLCHPLPLADPPDAICGAMVPHAGWSCSGRIAGGTFAALSDHTAARTFVLTGSVHTVELRHPAVDCADAWSTPLGTVAVDVELREAIGELDGFAALDAPHVHEHSLEVQLPLMQTVFGDDLSIVPCMIPPLEDAVRWGAAIGRLLRDWPRPVVMIASADLTHYGRGYGFTPHGSGRAGREWAHSVNDRELLDLVERMAADEIVAHSIDHRSACGGGAIAATVAACHEMGATRGCLLEHTNSARELGELGGADSVGYAGVVLG